jgi:hypothetical protein
MPIILLHVGLPEMRCKVVIGGQPLSKTMKGSLIFRPEFFGREGILTSLLLLVGPLPVLWLLTRLLPPWLPRRAASV